MKNKLILSISIVLIILSLLLCIKTAADKREINKYKQGQFSYADFGNGIVELTMASGEVVRLCFDKNSVKAERSYKVKDRAEQVYLIAFVYFYGWKTDIKIERSVAICSENFAYIMRYMLWDTREKTRQTRTWTMTATDGGTLIL